MKKPNRVLELSFYEWSIFRWTTSDTRNALDATGIGIYRELLDRCYAQGSIPANPELQCRIAKCTAEQLSDAWPLMKSNFRALKNHSERLENVTATVFRKNNFEFRTTQGTNGQKGGRRKANRNKDMSSDPSAHGLATLEKVSSQLNLTKLNLTKLNLTNTNLTNRKPPPTQYGDWPLAAAAVEENFDCDVPLILKITQAAAMELVSIPEPKIELTDAILAKAIRHCYRGDTQTSAGLYLTTVPACIRSWAKNGIRSRDSPKPKEQIFSDLPVFQGWEKPID